MEKEGIFNNIFCEALIPTTDKNTAREGQTSIPHEHRKKTQNISQLKPAIHKKGNNITTKWGSYHKGNTGSIFKYQCNSP